MTISACVYLYILFGYAIAETVFDRWKSRRFYRACERNPKFFLQNFLHHLTFSFILTGWLCDDVTVLGLYLFSISWIILDWEANAGYCSLTMQMNELCGQPRGAYFRDFFYWIGLKTTKYGGLLYQTYMMIALCVGCVKFWNRIKTCWGHTKSI